MRLAKAHVHLYRNIVDSNSAQIEPNITCLVGKNESGKTAFLRALYNLNPVYEDGFDLDVTEDYPRWRRSPDAREKNLDEVSPIEAAFSLDESELTQLVDDVGFPLPADVHLIVARTYSNTFIIRLELDQRALVRLLLDSVPLPSEMKDAGQKCTHVRELAAFLKEQQVPKDQKSTNKALAELSSRVTGAVETFENGIPKEKQEAIFERLPQFFYFSQYSELKGRLDLSKLLARAEDKTIKLQDHERTALSLLRLAGVKGSEFMDKSFEKRIGELEAAANGLSNEVFKYWTQNEDLMISLHGDSDTVATPQGQTAVHKFLDIRLNDLRHQATTNFERRSAGFRWFFSFIAAFSEFERQKNVIILLDEPGLSLHARGQADLLRYIDERLGPKNQLIYTTHSPFMVNPARLERARTVEDLSTRKQPDIGAKISDEVFSAQGDTLFPLQAALGYDLAQNLFVGPHNLVVEGGADWTYLSTLSEHLETIGRRGLDKRWKVTPAGGADKIPTFVALLGTQLDLTVLLDASGVGNQRLTDLVNRGMLESKRILTVAKVTGTKRADIEDLFEPAEYLLLYNAAFGKSVKLSDIPGDDPILRRLERLEGEKFDHGRPATALLRDRVDFLKKLGNQTINRFDALFTLINATLP